MSKLNEEAERLRSELQRNMTAQRVASFFMGNARANNNYKRIAIHEHIKDNLVHRAQQITHELAQIDVQVRQIQERRAAASQLHIQRQAYRAAIQAAKDDIAQRNQGCYIQ